MGGVFGKDKGDHSDDHPTMLPKKHKKQTDDSFKMGGNAQFGGKLFGTSITTLMGHRPDLPAPRVVVQCVTFLRQHGLGDEGLFRVAGDNDDLAQLKKLLNTHKLIRWGGQPVGTRKARRPTPPTR